MTENNWATNDNIYYNRYFSFSAQGGNYTIQWGDGKGGESGYATASWQSTNSRVTNSTTTVLFKNQSNGYSNPRTISVPDTGYVIIYCGGSHIRYSR
jgi:hypothetical protein